MNDLEIIERCAQAMGLDAMAIEQSLFDYDPLHNDAQAMGLVKRFDMTIEREKDHSFGVTIFTKRRRVTHDVTVVRNQPDLNRAICECVAKLATQPSGARGRE